MKMKIIHLMIVSHLSLNTSDTSSITKTRQSKQLPSKEKNINNYISKNTKKTEGTF